MYAQKSRGSLSIVFTYGLFLLPRRTAHKYWQLAKVITGGNEPVKLVKSWGSQQGFQINNILNMGININKLILLSSMNNKMFLYNWGLLTTFCNPVK